MGGDCLGPYYINLHHFILDQLKLWKIKPDLSSGYISLFDEWYPLFFSWYFHYFLLFFHKACSSTLELSIESHQHYFLFQSWWFLCKNSPPHAGLELSMSFENFCFHCRNEDKCCGENIFPSGASKNLPRQLWAETLFWKGKQHSKAQGFLKFNSLLVKGNIS